MDRVKLEVLPRTDPGSRAARRLRKQGQIPGVLYGAGKPAVLLAVDAHALREAVSTDAGLHAVLDITLEGHTRGHVAIVKDYQLDKVKHIITHVDFQEVKLDELIESDVAITVEGMPEGVKIGGILDVSTRQVTVSAFPTDMPDHLTLDVSALNIGDVLHVSDLVVPDNVRIVDDPEEVVCSVLAPRIAEVTEEEAAEAEEAAAAAGEPELVGEQPEEPEAAE